jgi:hypothetical protein
MGVFGTGTKKIFKLMMILIKNSNLMQKNVFFDIVETLLAIKTSVKCRYLRFFISFINNEIWNSENLVYPLPPLFQFVVEEQSIFGGGGDHSKI